MTAIHAVFIDPWAQTVSDVEIPSHHVGTAQFEAMKALMQCQWLAHVDLGANQSLWCDDEGAMMDWDMQRFFCTRNARTGQIQGQAIAGRSIMSGRRGPDIVAAAVHAADVRRLIVWTDARQVVIPAMTIAAAEFGPDGTLRPTETPQPVDGSARTYNYHRQPSKR